MVILYRQTALRLCKELPGDVGSEELHACLCRRVNELLRSGRGHKLAAAMPAYRRARRRLQQRWRQGPPSVRRTVELTKLYVRRVRNAVNSHQRNTAAYHRALGAAGLLRPEEQPESEATRLWGRRVYFAEDAVACAEELIERCDFFHYGWTLRQLGHCPRQSGRRLRRHQQRFAVARTDCPALAAL